MRSNQRGTPIKASQPGVVPQDVFSDEQMARIAKQMEKRHPVDLSQYRKIAQDMPQEGDQFNTPAGDTITIMLVDSGSDRIEYNRPGEGGAGAESLEDFMMGVMEGSYTKVASKPSVLQFRKLSEIPKDFESLGTGMYRKGHNLWSLSQQDNGFILVRAKEEFGDKDDDEEKESQVEIKPPGTSVTDDIPPPPRPVQAQKENNKDDEKKKDEEKADKKEAIDTTMKDYYQSYYGDGYGTALTEDKRSLIAPIVARAFFRYMGRTMPQEVYGKRPEWMKLASKYGKDTVQEIVQWIGEGITQRRMAQKFGVHPLAGLEWKEVITAVGPKNAQLLRQQLFRSGDKRHLRASYSDDILKRAYKAKDLELRARTRKKSVDEAAKDYWISLYGIYGEELVKNVREIVLGAPQG